MSGYPVLHLDANGNPMDYDPENDSDYQWDYLNASGVGNALKNASETNPVVITYTFSNELLLSGIGHTQPNVANASRNSIRKFFIKTYDAADNVTRHPATGTFLAHRPNQHLGDFHGSRRVRRRNSHEEARVLHRPGPLHDLPGSRQQRPVLLRADLQSHGQHLRLGARQKRTLEGNLVTQATQDNQLDVYVGNGSDETLLGSVSGHPHLDTAPDGTLATSYNDVVDFKAWGGYLNAMGVGNALLDATPAQPVVITYTFASEVSLSQLAYTQFYAHNANRHSLRGFFVETVYASGAALRIPTDGTSLFSATPETTNEWEVFDLGGARKAKQLRSASRSPPVYGGGNGAHGATATDSNSLYFYELIFRIDATRAPLGGAYADAGATATDNVDGDLTASIVATSTVNTAQKGTYEVRYDVSDAAGNPAAQVVRTVQVVEAPSMALRGGSYVVVTQGQAFADAARRHLWAPRTSAGPSPPSGRWTRTSPVSTS